MCLLLKKTITGLSGHPDLNLPFLGKVIERAGLLRCCCYPGFLPAWLPALPPAGDFTDLQRHLDWGRLTLLLLLDLTTAFDMVNYDLLTLHLANVGNIGDWPTIAFFFHPQLGTEGGTWGWIRDVCSTSTRARTFLALASTWQNELPLEIRALWYLLQFFRACKPELFQQGFGWGSGYPSQSLLQVVPVSDAKLRL